VRVVFGRRRRELEQELEAARQQQAALQERAGRAETELTAARAQLDTVKAERDATVADLATTATERDSARHAVTGELEALAKERDELQAALTASAAAEDEAETGIPDGRWPLLLADLERRWPRPPGAARPVDTDDVAAQLASALAGELERLREEVGVDAEVTIAKTVVPARPTVFLLAALDLIGALTSICERVVVTLDDELRLTGRSWEGRRDELDTARTRALAAGAVVSAVEIADDEVHLTLLPTAAD
jgi:hypothetical protein